MSEAITIGIDARSIVGQPTGVGRYVTNLVRHMATRDASVRFRLYMPAPPVAEGIPAGVECSVLPMPGTPLGGLDNVFTWNHLRLPMHLLRRPVDLLHCPFYTLPALCPVPAVVTIHDITFELHPEWYTRRARVALGGFASRSARKSRHVLTVSECSRRDIVETYGIPASRVTAVPLAPDPEFAPVEDPDVLESTRRTYGLPRRYLLHVGSITPRRNIGRLLDAFASLRAHDPRVRDVVLAIAGVVEPPSTPLDEQVRIRDLHDAVRAIGYAQSSDLPALYSGAEAVVYPSLYEGFGLPVLESMACGTPVLCSDTSCFPEVAGDAALLVDPLDVEALAAGIGSLLSDTALRQRLVERGLTRAGRHTWQGAADRTLAVYHEALAGASAMVSG